MTTYARDLAGVDDRARLTEALNSLRLNTISELLALTSKFAAAGSLAAERGDANELAIRAGQTIASIREAVLVIASLGQAEVLP